MNQPRDNERLLADVLADVLADESADGFREALLSETLGLVRRRRRSRQAWRTATALALVAGLGVLLWRSLVPHASAPEQHGPGYALILSMPLPAASLVSTQPLAASLFVASRTNAEVVQTASSTATPREINDSELLALVGHKPAALVRLGPHAAELVFINQEDKDELFRN
jgi:hypothetical protein